MLRMDQTQRYGTKGDQPGIPVFCDPHQLSDQAFTNIDELPMPFDLSVGTHPSYFCQGRVSHISKIRGIQSGRRYVNTSWRDLSQSFMRALCVIDREETVASFLLSLRSRCWRFHGLVLQCAMQPLMSAILFRVTRLYALRHNPQLDPPHGKRRQSPGTCRGEGRPIVSTNSQRQPVLLENPLEHGLYVGIIRLGENMAAKEHAGAGIADGQRVAARSVTGAKPTLEIGAPDAVWTIGTQEWLKPRTGAPAALAPGNHPVSAQDSAASADRWPRPGYLRSFAQARHKFGRSPSGVSLFGSNHCQDYFHRRGSGTAMRSAGALVKPRHAFGDKTPYPFMGCLPAHFELSSKLGHSISSGLVQTHHLQSLFHNAGLFPRQGSTSLPVKLPVTHVFSKHVTSVSGLYPL
jgi:hypothetical protein